MATGGPAQTATSARLPDSPVTPGRIALYAVMVVVWGSSFFFTSLALRSFNPFLIVQVRMTIAAVILGAVIWITGRTLPRSARTWGHFVVLGLIGIALPFSLLTWGQVQVPSSTAIVLSSTTPIFVFIFATLVLKNERFEGLKLVGIVVAFGGVGLLSSGGGAALGGWIWPVMIVAASVLYGATNVYVRTFVQSVDPIVVAFLQLGIGALWLAPVTTFTGSWHVEDPSLISIIAVLELGIVASAVTYVLFFHFIQTWGSTAASLNTYLQPAVGVLLGVLVLGERLSLTSWAALGVIACGVFAFGWVSLRSSGLARRAARSRGAA